jgi:hypothetical protein
VCVCVCLKQVTDLPKLLDTMGLGEGVGISPISTCSLTGRQSPPAVRNISSSTTTNEDKTTKCLINS